MLIALSQWSRPGSTGDLTARLRLEPHEPDRQALTPVLKILVAADLVAADDARPLKFVITDSGYRAVAVLPRTGVRRPRRR